MKRVVVAPALLLFLASALAAQQPSPQSNSTQPVFRSATQLVPLSVTVTDHNNEFVKGLSATDFAVFEDGVQQELQFFESSQVPLDLILLLDTSSSMSDKIDVVHEAAIGFIRTLRPGDRGAIVAFADGVDFVQPLTSERSLLEQAVRRTIARGATSLHNALYIALKQFGRGARQQGDLRRQAIAVLSDGEDTASLVSFDDVLAVAQKSGVSIYPIGLQSKYTSARLAHAGPKRSYSESEYSMRTLAQQTGAIAFFPQQVFELKNIYGAIARELCSQYSLAYAPSNMRADGRFRRIAVRITSRPELRLRTRTGYTADLERASALPVLHQR